MRKAAGVLLVCASILAVAAPTYADKCTRTLRQLEGWTIMSVTQVDGEFQGCEHGRVIRFMDGSVFECGEYGYQYAYSPDAIIFGKSRTINGMTFVQIKALIEGEVYDMQPVAIEAK